MCYKNTLLLCFLMLLYQNAFSQNNISRRAVSAYSQPTMLDHYKIDYQLVDETLLGQDSLIVEQIDQNFIESNREENEDVIKFCATIQADVLIYSATKTTANKSRSFGTIIHSNK